MTERGSRVGGISVLMIMSFISMVVGEGRGRIEGRRNFSSYDHFIHINGCGGGERKDRG